MENVWKILTQSQKLLYKTYGKAANCLTGGAR